MRARASPSRMLQPQWAGSDGLARATPLGVPTTATGVDGLIGMPGFEDIDIVFDVTSAVAHIANAERLATGISSHEGAADHTVAARYRNNRRAEARAFTRR